VTLALGEDSAADTAPPRLTMRPVGAHACTIGGFDAETFSLLRTEAQVQRQFAERDEWDDYGIEGAWLRSPRRYHYAACGPRLAALHQLPDLCDMLSSVAGAALCPTRSSYLFYSPGDFVGLHTDRYGCDITTLIRLDGGDEPLLFVDEAPTMNLLNLARAADGAPPPSGAWTVPSNRALAIAGRLVPHYRPPTACAVTIATLCFQRLA
jgi:hypothetical protein